MKLALFLTTFVVLLLAAQGLAIAPHPNAGGDGGGGGTWCLGPAQDGHLQAINGHIYQCTEGRGAYWAWWYLSPFGYIDGYPYVLDCPCWYYRYYSG